MRPVGQTSREPHRQTLGPTAYVVENAKKLSIRDVRSCVCHAEGLKWVRLHAAESLLEDDSFPLADTGTRHRGGDEGRSP